MFIEQPNIYAIHTEDADDISLIDRIWGTNIAECYNLESPNGKDLVLHLEEGQSLQDFLEVWGELVGEERLDEALGGLNG